MAQTALPFPARRPRRRTGRPPTTARTAQSWPATAQANLLPRAPQEGSVPPFEGVPLSGDPGRDRVAMARNRAAVEALDRSASRAGEILGRLVFRAGPGRRPPLYQIVAAGSRSVPLRYLETVSGPGNQDPDYGDGISLPRRHVEDFLAWRDRGRRRDR